MLILRRNIQAPCLLRRGMAYNLSALGEFSTGSTREYSTGVDSDGIWSVGRLRSVASPILQRLLESGRPLNPTWPGCTTAADWELEAVLVFMLAVAGPLVMERDISLGPSHIRSVAKSRYSSLFARGCKAARSGQVNGRAEELFRARTDPEAIWR